MEPGDCIMARDIWGSGDELDDSAQAWILPRCVNCVFEAVHLLTFHREAIATDLVELMNKTRLAMLGERKDRDRTKPRKVDGVWHGGTAAERHDQAVNIDKADRCYTWGQSFQVLRKLVGPSAGSKVYQHSYNEHHELRRDSLNVRYTCAA